MSVVAIIATLKKISAAILIIIVLYGTYYYDPRFTALLLPPVVLMNTRDFMPKWVQTKQQEINDSYGVWPLRIGLMLAGLGCGLYLGDGFDPAKIMSFVS